MSFDVFISYSQKDRAQAESVCEKLEAANVRCWIAPRNINPGSDWAESIIGALASARPWSSFSPPAPIPPRRSSARSSAPSSAASPSCPSASRTSSPAPPSSTTWALSTGSMPSLPPSSTTSINSPPSSVPLPTSPSSPPLSPPRPGPSPLPPSPRPKTKSPPSFGSPARNSPRTPLSHCASSSSSIRQLSPATVRPSPSVSRIAPPIPRESRPHPRVKRPRLQSLQSLPPTPSRRRQQRSPRDRGPQGRQLRPPLPCPLLPGQFPLQSSRHLPIHRQCRPRRPERPHQCPRYPGRPRCTDTRRRVPQVLQPRPPRRHHHP
jgi:hypothetical protein